jgi:hypothetical protein
MTMTHIPQKLSLGAAALAAIGSLLAPCAAGAAEMPSFLNAPATAAAPAPKLAVQFELKLRLPEGRGLARLLLDAGVDRDDAAAAARLAAGHLGDGLGGCEAEVSISRSVEGGGFRLVRVMLMTQADQTVIERRGSGLAIASQAGARKTPRLV